MANTQVFTLGLGVTVTNPLGHAIEQLRQDVERLRRQADGTRLGRLIGEVIRLGLELGKVRQVERQLALDQEQQHEGQITRLWSEAEAVERLRQHYLMLDQVIAGLAKFKTLTVDGAKRGQSSGSGSKTPDAAPEASSRTRRSAAESAMVLTSVLGGGLIVGARTAYEVDRHLPPERRQRARKAVSIRRETGVVNAVVSGAKAWLEGDSPEDKAKGVGAAAGELGGSLLGAALGATLSKNSRVQEYASMAGGFIGEWVGGVLGGGLYDLAMYEDKPGPRAKSSTTAAASITDGNAKGSVSRDKAPQSNERQANEDEEEELEEEEEEEEVDEGLEEERETRQPQPSAPYSGAPSLEQASLAASSARTQRAVRGFGLAPLSPSPGQGGSSGFGVVKGLVRRVPVGALLDASLQLADTYSSNATPAQKMEGYGSAAGGLGGSLAGAAAGAAVGSVVPVIGTAVGGLIGGVIGSMGGESLGNWLGKALGAGLSNEGASTSTPAVSASSHLGITSSVVGQAPGAQAPAGSGVHVSEAATAQSAPTLATPPAPTNQQFTFTANMPVTFNNSFDDPTTLQQLEAIARRVLDDLMRQARSVQMADQPQP